jgi:hypothetical protein
MTATTRRAALGALASASALALPAVAVAAATEPGADAEILALRLEFERLQAIRLPLKKTYRPQQLLFDEIGDERGWDAANAWGEQSGFWEINDQVADVDLSMGSLVERMIALRPKSLAGIIAIARSLKEEPLDTYWDEPDEDRDWDVMLVTRFLDVLIEIGQPRPV